jgi:quinol monooxygenase YgiN
VAWLDPAGYYRQHTGMRLPRFEYVVRQFSGGQMTAIVIARYRSNAADYERIAQVRHADFDVLKEIAVAEGCLHHRVAVSDEDQEVILIDEWPDAEAYNRFALNPAVINILRGWALEDPPETDYFRLIHDPAEF